MGAPELARVEDEQVDTRPLLGGAVHASLLTGRAVCVKWNIAAEPYSQRRAVSFGAIGQTLTHVLKGQPGEPGRIRFCVLF